MNTNSKLSDKVSQYVMTISDEEYANISVNNLAKYFNIDRFKLSRSFKKETGLTADQFIFREKMNRASSMLLKSQMTVKQVGKILGFCTTDYFIRVFRDFFGIVPGRYKEYKTSRSGKSDRRNNKKDRRRKTRKNKIPTDGDRRNGLKDRRKGIKDRRNFSAIKIQETMLSGKSRKKSQK